MTSHGTSVYNILKQVCPEANIKIKCDYTKDDDFDIYTTSLFFGSDKTKAKRSQELIHKDKILICAAGNENTKSSTVLSKFDQWLSIGACRLINGKPVITNYSSKFDGLDFMSFSHLEVENEKSRINGTSFSAPLFAGMVALIQCYFLQTKGRKLTYDELLEYLIKNSVDLGDGGRDDKYGYGLLILPNVEVDERKIKLKINSNIAYVNGKEVILDTEPIIHNNRTLVPIRFIAENLGYNVEWNEVDREVIITN